MTNNENMLLCEILEVDDEIIVIEDKRYARTFVQPSERVKIHAYFEIGGKEEPSLEKGTFISASHCYFWNESEKEKENVVCLRVEAPYEIHKAGVDIPYVYSVVVEGTLIRGQRSTIRSLPTNKDRLFLPATVSLAVGPMRRLYLLTLAFDDVATELDKVAARSLCRFNGVLNNTRQSTGYELNLADFRVIRGPTH